MVRVKLIAANAVKEELKLLKRALADRPCPSKAKAIAAAKRLVRNGLVAQAMPGAIHVQNVPQPVLDVYRTFLDDVGDNTFVYSDVQIKKVARAVKENSKKGGK